MAQCVTVLTDGTEVFESDFDFLIAEACEKYEISDLTAEGQRRFKAVLSYIGRHMFGDRENLKESEIRNHHKKYDDNTIWDLYIYYIDLCYRYNKLVSETGFELLLNIPVGTIHSNWNYVKGIDKPNRRIYTIQKDIYKRREETLKDHAADNKNIMGTFQVGRLEYGWDMPHTRNDESSARALPASELPRLDQQREADTLPDEGGGSDIF